MSEDKCETVEVLSAEAPGGVVVINKSDYDPAVHTIKGCEQTKQGESKGKRGKK